MPPTIKETRGANNAHYGTPEHFNGTADTNNAVIIPSGRLLSALIHNTGDTNNLLVSFDGGTTFKTIGITAGDNSLSIACDVASFIIKASAATTTYEILLTYEPVTMRERIVDRICD